MHLDSICPSGVTGKKIDISLFKIINNRKILILDKDFSGEGVITLLTNEQRAINDTASLGHDKTVISRTHGVTNWLIRCVAYGIAAARVY